MTFYRGIFQNKVLISCMVAWFIAQTLKILLSLYKDKKLDLTRFVGAGGMPSSHTAFVMSLATSVGKINGWDSPSFAISIVLAFIVMYDAAGVRRAAGKQAKILNIIINDLAQHKPLGEEKLKELLGHTPVEVLAGALLGIIIANIFT